jgi:HK97 family phage major capsid protein
MAASLNKLQDRAAAVAALLDDLAKVEDRTEAQAADVAKLSAEATELEERLAVETAIAEKVASLRGKVAATAKPVAVESVEAPAVRKAPRYDRYKVFGSTDDAEICGRWIRGFLLNRTEDRAWYERNVETRALSSDDNSKGGVLIPETFAATVIRLVDSFSAIPQQANVIPMSSNTLYVPRRVSGNTAYFVSDNTETTASDMATDNVMLNTKDCRVATRVPNSLIEDSVVDLASLVAQEFALALSRKIDDAGFAGDGTSTHGGIRGIQWLFENTSPTLAGVNDSGESALSALSIDDFAETIGKLPSYARPTAGWYVTPQVWSTAMLSLGLSAGGVSAAELASGMAEARFMGYPVRFNNSMRTAGSSNGVVALFGDMRLSTHYGIRQAIQVRASTDRYIEFDQTYFQAMCRFDVVTSDIGTASAAGPVVALTL